MLHDVFICHASEDKDGFVRPLADALKAHHIEVWYDEFSLSIGDSLRQTIDKGLASTRFGIVVLSPSFFGKGWANHELNGLVSRHIADGSVILPIWHNVEHDDILRFSPPLADMVAVSSSDGMESVVRALVHKVRPQESPLNTASHFLRKRGLNPPPISDEWWLDIVETKEAEFLFPNLNHEWHWIFPLPFAAGTRGKGRGINIGWTALQLDWSADGDARKICQLTHPHEVQEFLNEWPGLYECALQYPHILALYAPQLTIPGFDEGFASEFDRLLLPENINRCEAFRYGRAETTDGNAPLCGDFIAWRHPTYGNHTAGSLSHSFATAHTGQYSREVFSGFECIIWLLSQNADWMPDSLRETLKLGFKERVHWWITDHRYLQIAEFLHGRSRSKFSYTKALKEVLLDLCKSALYELKIDESASDICDRFIDCGFLEGFYDERDKINQRRKDRLNTFGN